jgi:Pyruvate/2-oxoacid:ferredoxin oxidoreductase delta subunit
MNRFKEVIIFYFSGTGNSKQISGWFAEYAVKKGIKCTLYNIADTNTNSLHIENPEVLIIIISPVHGFNYPNITLKFIKNFPKGKNPAVLMVTRGGLKLWKLPIPGVTGISFLLASIILKIKGYKIIGQIPFDMPATWLSFHPALRGNALKFIFDRNIKKVEKHADKIFVNGSNFTAYRDIIQDILVSPIAIVYYFFGRFFLAKTLYASTKCNNCDLCITQCPVQAITKINSRPFWKLRCESCMKCINTCPQRAVETAHGLVLISVILANILIGILINYYHFNWFISSSLENLFCFTLLLIFYKLQHIILNKKAIGKLISYTSLTYYKFWGRYNINTELNNRNKS